MANVRLHRVLVFASILALLVAVQVCAQPAEERRVTEGLVVLYLFNEGEGPVVNDRSEVGEPLDLVISDPDQVRWIEGGGLEIMGENVVLRTEWVADKVTDWPQATNELTIEAVITPANASQEGPARIVSLSADPAVRNFTLGQHQDTYALRLRTSETDRQGTPDLATPRGVTGTSRCPLCNSLVGERQHVLVTYKEHVVSMYVNGDLVAQHERAGDFSNWDPDFHLLVGNEGTLDRQWHGKVELVAIYDRALSAEDVQRNHRASAPE